MIGTLVWNRNLDLILLFQPVGGTYYLCLAFSAETIRFGKPINQEKILNEYCITIFILKATVPCKI